MKRYQVYLNPYSISVLDDLEEALDISRSKQLRLVIDRVAEVLGSILRAKEVSKAKEKFFLDDLAGFVNLKTDKKIDLTEDIDDAIYFQNYK